MGRTTPLDPHHWKRRGRLFKTDKHAELRLCRAPAHAGKLSGEACCWECSVCACFLSRWLASRGCSRRRRRARAPVVVCLGRDGCDHCLAATTESQSSPRLLTGACSRKQGPAHRSRGASASQRGPGACALKPRLRISSSGNDRPAYGDVRRGALRASGVQGHYDTGLHTGPERTCPAPSTRRGGTACGVQTRVAARLARVGRGRGSITRLAGVGVVRGL